jgi:uncharacterized protein (DUF1778 family)
MNQADEKPRETGLSRRLNFRIDEAAYTLFVEKAAAAGMTQSEFFRKVVCLNKTQVIARAPMTEHRRHALYLLNKASNNINQLAKAANIAHQAGKVSEETYTAILTNLDHLTRLMKASLEHVG